MIKLAKDSLLGEEAVPKPFYSFALPRSLSSLRIPFLTIFLFLMAGMISTSQAHFPSHQDTKNAIGGRIQRIYSRISGSIPPSDPALPLDNERLQNSEKEPLENPERASQEVSK